MARLKKGLLLLVLVVFGLAACGTTEDAESNGGGSGKGDKKQVTIGVSQFVEHPSLDAAFKGFKDALAEGGFKEGDNVKFDVQNAQADMNNTQTIAKNLAADKVDLIFANATPNAQAALNATKDIPIIFTSVTDPVGAKLVESMDKAGSNITGTTDTHPDAIPNTVKFIAGMGIKNVGMVYNAGEQNSVAQIELVKKAMEGTDLKIVEAPVANTSEVKQATESLVGRVDALYIITDNTVVSALESVIQVAEEKDLPLFVGELDSVKRGGFAAYGFDYYDIGFEAGQMAVQVLKGEKKISELPPQFPQNLKLAINKGAAEKMGIELKPEWESEAEFIE